MGRVVLQDLKTGAVLEEDVRDINGRLLLCKGQSVDAEHIRILKIWGVSEVEVTQAQTAAVSSTQVEDDRGRADARRSVETILQHIETSHPGIAVIVRTATDYRHRNGLMAAFGPTQPLSVDFKLDLSTGLKTQIEFSEIELPESSAIIADFNAVFQDPSASASDMADVIARSPSLTALLIKIANSAAFGFLSKIDTVTRAVAMLGAREVNALVMGIAVMGIFQGIPKDLVDIHTFVRHSLACGILSRILAAHRQLQNTERLFVSGLLHDIGRLVLYRYFPEQAKLLLQMARKTGLSVYELEAECLGVRHAQIAEPLLRKWNFPAALQNAIVHHHRPSRSADPAEAAIVHMADLAVNAIGLGHSGEHIVPRFEPMAWDALAIAPGALETALKQTIQQLGIMEALFMEVMNDI